MAERWLPVPNFPGYKISSHGRLFSYPKTFHRTEWRYHRPVTVITQGGFIAGWVKKRRDNLPVCVNVTLIRNGRKYETRLHRIVLEAFRGPCPKGCEGCHNDGDPLNNRLSNLRWDTHINNMVDAERHGRRTNPPTHWGQNHPKATLSDAQIRRIRSTPIRRGTKAALARKYKTSQTTIRRILAGLTRNYDPKNAASHKPARSSHRR